MAIIEILDQQELYAAIIRLAIDSVRSLTELADRIVDNQEDLNYLYKRVALDTGSDDQLHHLRRFVAARDSITTNLNNIVTRHTTDEGIARISKAILKDSYDHLDVFKDQLPESDFSMEQRREHEHYLGIKDRYLEEFREKFATHRTNLLNKNNFEDSLENHPLRLSTLRSGRPLARELKTESLSFFRQV